MKLLFDQNLSPNLVNLLADLFPNSTHVQDAGLDAVEDTELWDYARNNDYLIVSKDADFRHRSTVSIVLRIILSGVYLAFVRLKI